MNIYNEDNLIKEIATDLLNNLREIPKGTSRFKIDKAVEGILDVSRKDSTLVSNITLCDIPLTQESNDFANSCCVVLGVQFYACYKMDNQWNYKRVILSEFSEIESIKFNDPYETVVPYSKCEEILAEVIKHCYVTLNEDELHSLLRPVFTEMLEKADDSIFNFTMSLNSDIKDSVGETVTLTDILLDEEGVYGNVLHVFIPEDTLDEKQKIDLQEVINRYDVDNFGERRTILIPKKPTGAVVAILADTIC